MTDKHLRIIQAMTPARKLKAAEQLYWSARRVQHPDWDEERVQRTLHEALMYATG